VLEYTGRFDGLNAVTMAALELTQAELKAAFEAIPAAQREALPQPVAAPTGGVGTKVDTFA